MNSDGVWVKRRKLAQHEHWDVWECRSDPQLAERGPTVTAKLLYSKEGGYIGAADDSVVEVLGRRGIRPELVPGHTVCSIGYSQREGKWYGWSHRAIYGFQVGDVVEKGDSTDESLPIGFRAKTLADAKKMAIAFAESVS